MRRHITLWEGEDSNLRRRSRRFYRPLPLAARAPSRKRRVDYRIMPKSDFSFDIVSEVSMPEVGNAVDQAQREIQQRFDFKNTGTMISRDEKLIELRSSTEDRLKAALEVLKDKAVRREISLKALSEGPIQPAATGTVP